jgi:hypothetical protein
LQGQVLHCFKWVGLVQQDEGVAFGREVGLGLQQLFDIVIDLSDYIRPKVHVDVVEADHSVASDVGGLVFQVLGDGVGERLEHTLVHDARDQSQRATP